MSQSDTQVPAKAVVKRKRLRTVIVCLLIGAAMLLVMVHIIGRLWVGPMESQMRAGKAYMDSLSDKDIQDWIERTKTILSEPKPDAQDEIGVYSNYPPSKPRSEEHT